VYPIIEAADTDYAADCERPITRGRYFE